MQGKVKLIFCTDGIFPHMVGGIQRHSLLLATELAKSGEVDITVIHPHAGVTVFEPSLGIHEVVVAAPKKTGRYLADCYLYSKEVLKFILQHPDAVVYGQGFAVWAGMSKIRNRLIINPHGLEPFQGLRLSDKLLGIPFRMILRHQFRNAARVVSLGGRLTGIIRSNGARDSFVVLPNACNVPEPTVRKFDSSQVNFLFVGRFAYNKGIDVLALAAKELNEEGYDQRFSLSLVGKGPLYDEYVQKYSMPNIEFVGFASDEKLNELYRVKDVFVLPTLFEGMPTVVLEAMACGMPVIVTDTGATTEMVDEANGFIIDKKDVNSLKSAMIQFMEMDPARRKSLSEASYNRVRENFTWKIISDRHISLFRQIADEMKSRND
jgi:glycosyltransferase involved in cell wall biosynthesis